MTKRNRIGVVVVTSQLVVGGLMACGGSGGSGGSGGAGGSGATAGTGGSGGKRRPTCTMTDLELQGDITEDLTIEAGCEIRVVDDVWVMNGATLTVEEGATLRFVAEVVMRVGDQNGTACGDSCTGALKVEGSPDNPVTFTSDESAPAPGDWGPLVFGGALIEGSVIENAHIEFGGADDTAVLRVYDAEGLFSGHLAVRDTTFENNRGPDVSVQFSNAGAPFGPTFAAFSNNTFADNKNNLVLEAPTVADVDATNSIAGGIEVRPTRSANQRIYAPDAVWPNHGVPYVIPDDITVAHTSLNPDNTTEIGKLTIESGAVLRFGPGARLKVGDLNSNGSLVATGVTFSSGAATPAAGDWDGIFFATATKASTLDGCTFRYALGEGAQPTVNDGVITLQQGTTEDIAPELTITNTTFENNGGTLNIFADTSQEGAAICDKYVTSAGNTFDLTPCE